MSTDLSRTLKCWLKNVVCVVSSGAKDEDATNGIQSTDTNETKHEKYQMSNKRKSRR
jgi:hypothetical protein